MELTEFIKQRNEKAAAQLRKDIGQRLKQFRKEKGFKSQASFASDVGTTRAAYSKYETGEVAPGDPFIQLLCSKFNLSEHWLRTGDGEMIQETEDTLFSSFAAHYDLSANEQALARYLLDLSSEERQAVLKHILAMADAIRGSQQAALPTRPSEPDPGKVDPIEQELSDYRKELEAEKKGATSSVSAGGKEKGA